jgi:Membrane domain of glycerophosphoryl diester phosphodiesterase
MKRSAVYHAHRRYERLHIVLFHVNPERGAEMKAMAKESLSYGQREGRGSRSSTSVSGGVAMVDEHLRPLTESVAPEQSAFLPPRPDVGDVPAAPPVTADEPNGSPRSPRTLSTILSEAIHLYRRWWKTLLLVAAMINVPFLLLQEFVTHSVSNADPSSVGSSTARDVGTTFTFANNVFVRPLVYYAMLVAVATVCAGERPLVGRAYRIALRHLRSVLWVMFLALAGITLAMVAANWAAGAEGGVAAFLIVVVPAGLVVAAILYVRWLFALPVVMIEGRRGRSALSRAWALSDGAFWKIGLTTIVAHILILIVDAVLRLSGETLSSMMGSSGWIAMGAAIAISSVVTTPFNVLIAVLLYDDQRRREDGLDALTATAITAVWRDSAS